MLKSIQHKSINQLLWSSQLLRPQGLPGPRVEGLLTALQSHHHTTKCRTGSSESKCTSCWPQQLGWLLATPPGGFCSAGRKRRCLLFQRGKVQESLAPALHWLLLLHAGRGMTREGKHQGGQGSCNSYTMPPSLSFSYVSWKTNCSQPCELYLKHLHEP